VTTSATYDFNPSLGEMVLYAFNLIGVRPTAITQSHMESARMAANMLQSRWANQGVNLWAVDLVTVPLVTGQATYDLDPNIVVMLDAYMTTVAGSVSTDRIILPISRTEYASYPNKSQQGFTTVFWMDRLLAPTVTLWPVPDGTSAQYLKYYRVRQIQDANYTQAATIEIPYMWMEAFADGMAYRLARIWQPMMAPALKPIADESYNIAAMQNEETAQMYVSPQLSGYYRN
jgi:hypothetical protein